MATHRVPLNSPKIIGFCGYPGSGKDAAAAFLVARGWQRIAFADPLRKMALAIDPIIDAHPRVMASTAGNSMEIEPEKVRLSEMIGLHGWTNTKRHPEVRRLLQRIGTEAVREIIGPDTWVQIAERSIEVGKRVVFTDVRFANEAEMIRSRGGLICWVDRNGTDDAAHNKHASEKYPFRWDELILNNSTLQDLENRVLEIAGYSL